MHGSFSAGGLSTSVDDGGKCFFVVFNYARRELLAFCSLRMDLCAHTHGLKISMIVNSFGEMLFKLMHRCKTNYVKKKESKNLLDGLGSRVLKI
jgi:hypothetical protein